MAESNSPGEVPIWARPEPAGRRPRFSREQIAAAALAIADADGFQAVSMRRIAAALGAGTMSLYRYIATKADLLALLDDALIGETLVPESEMSGDWRKAIALVAIRTRATLVRHPWAVHALHGPGPAQSELAGPSPNGLRHFEQSLAALDGAPLDPKGKLDLLAIIDDYVMGHALRASELTARSDDSATARESAAENFISTQLATGEYPRLLALSAVPDARSLQGDQDRLEQRFERGLRLLIDGFVAEDTTDG